MNYFKFQTTTNEQKKMRKQKTQTITEQQNMHRNGICMTKKLKEKSFVEKQKENNNRYEVQIDECL